MNAKLGVRIASTLVQPAWTSTNASSSKTRRLHLQKNGVNATLGNALKYTSGSTDDNTQKSSGLSTGAKAGIGFGVAFMSRSYRHAGVLHYERRRHAPPVGDLAKHGPENIICLPLGSYGANKEQHELN